MSSRFPVTDSCGVLRIRWSLHLSQIERGEVYDPRLRTIMKIAKALEVPVEALLKNLPEDDEQEH